MKKKYWDVVQPLEREKRKNVLLSTKAKEISSEGRILGLEISDFICFVVAWL